MAGPRISERFIVTLAPLLALSACSFDAVGLTQTGEAITTGSSEASTGVGPTSDPSTVDPTGSVTTESPTSVGPAGEMSASDGTGPVEPMTSTSTTEAVTTMTSTGDDTGTDTSTGPGTTGCEEQMFYKDGDGDGFGDAALSKSACEAPDGYVLQDGDCDDKDSGSHPGSKELCDGADNDCDGVKDDFEPESNTECMGCEMYLYNPNNRVYLFCSGVKKWADAAVECGKRDAKLAKDIDGAHHTWLVAQLPNASGPWWIGGTAPGGDDKFKWTIDDSVVPGGDDSRWAGLRPAGGGNDRMVLVSGGNFDLWAGANGKWYDREDKDNQPYICERAYTP